MVSFGFTIIMNISKIEKIAEKEMRKKQVHKFREPGWLLYHGRRTGKIAVHLSKKLNLDVDKDLLYVTGLFHDIGKGKKPHTETGAKKTKDLLKDYTSKKELEEICRTIEDHNHRKKSDNFSTITKLIQDADLIDHVGNIDIWMAFYWCGSNEESIGEHLEWLNGKEYRQFREYMRTHMNYKLSKEILEQRIRKSDKFFEEFHHTYFKGI